MAGIVDIKEVAPAVYHIDDLVCGIAGLGSVYLLDAPRKAIVDCGPPTSAPAVLAGIRQAGIDPADIDYIVITHVHLDHAGGAATLLADMPRAKVVVHRRGARHMVDMEKLVAGTIAAQGPEINRRYGECLPVAPEYITEVGEGDIIELGGGQSLEFMDTPGHAPHELCIRETKNGGVFAGDALGLLLGDGRAMLTCHPPPSFDPELCIKTAQRIREMKPAYLYFAHFGTTADSDAVLGRVIRRLGELNDAAQAEYRRGDYEAMAKRLSVMMRDDLEPIRDLAELYQFSCEYLVASGTAGFVDYFSKKSA